MRHLIEGIDPDTEIQVTEQENKTICITSFKVNDFVNVELDLNKLHSFIGTLLHVQQKLKNR